MGQPVEVRSFCDHFSCSVRNVKSAQNQFPLVTQSKRMIDRTGGPVEERIAEERESSNAPIRTLLNEQRKTIITEYCEKVLHHESLAASSRNKIAEFYKRNYCDNNRIFVKFINKILLKKKELQKIPKFYLR